MAPADPGGGWDSAARQMSEAISGAKVIDKGVEVYNVPGAGGTIGLSQFTSKQSGKSNELMVMGLVMIGAIETNDSPVDLSKTTPLASLMSETEAIVVRTQSPYKKLSDLVDAMKKDPSGFSFGGGSAGRHRPDPRRAARGRRGRRPVQAEVRRLLGRRRGDAVVPLGLRRRRRHGPQRGHRAGRGRQAARPGRLLRRRSRSTASRCPTIKDQGLDVEVTNWRGVVGPPEMKDGDREAAIAAIQKMHDSQEWKDILEKKNLTDFFKYR